MTYFVYRNKKGKEIVHYFLNTNEFSCGKLQIPCLCKQHMHIKVFDVTRCSFLHNLEQRLIESMMGLRPRQGNIRLVLRLFSLMRGMPSIRLK